MCDSLKICKISGTIINLAVFVGETQKGTNVNLVCAIWSFLHNLCGVEFQKVADLGMCLI